MPEDRLHALANVGPSLYAPDCLYRRQKIAHGCRWVLSIDHLATQVIHPPFPLSPFGSWS
jgi:hypothetical protein